MPEADQEIRIKYSIDAGEVLKAFEDLRSASQQVQSDLIENATRLQITFKEAGEAMIKAKEDAIELQNALKQERGEIVPKRDLAEQRKELSDYKVEVRKAVSDLEKLEKDFAKTQQDRVKEVNKIRRDELKITQGIEKDALKQSQAAQKEYVKITQQGYGVMSSSAKEYGEVIQRTRKILEDTTKKSGKSLEEVASRMQKLGVPANQINQALKEMRNDAQQAVKVLNMFKGINIGAVNKQLEQTKDATVAFLNAMRGAYQATQPFGERVRGFVSSLGELGQVGQFIFGTVLGIGAVQAIRKVIDIFREAITSSLEFQQSLFTLEVAVRGLQRMGLDTTIASWDRRIADLKKQFPIFSRKEFVDAASLAALMTREFGFTEEQIVDLIRQSAILSEITGKDLNEAVRGITFAIGSGYFESLQRAGINISRQVVANEALAQGYKGVYNELEPVIRAQVTYSVIQKNLNAIQEDAGKIVETTTGQVKRLRAAWQDFLITLGSVITETDDAKESVEGLALAVETLTQAVEFYSDLEDGAKVSLLDIIFGPAYQNILNTLPNFNEGLKTFHDWLVRINALRNREPILDDLIGRGGRVPRAITPIREEEERRRINKVSELLPELVEIEEDIARKREEINIDLARRLEDIGIDSARRRRDVERDYLRRLDELAIDHQRNIDQAIAQASRQRAQVERSFALRRLELEEKFRQNELKAERDFQEKMQRLREGFLLNLEDAVRERDARQIIRLTKRFRLEKAQLEREVKNQGEIRKEQFQQELKELERQRAERQRVLSEELAFRIAQLESDFQFRQSQEEQRFQDEMDDIDRRENQRKIDALRRAEERREDAKRQALQRAEDLIAEFAEQEDITIHWAGAIRKAIEDEFGPGGNIDEIYDYFLAVIGNMTAAVQQMQTLSFLASRMQIALPKLTGADGLDYGGQQAEGGTIIAKKPTVAIFGEAGPEMATFTPLNKLGTESPAKITPASMSQMPMDGRIKVEMLLSPDLEAKIVDNTLDTIADVDFAIERARK